MATDKDFSTRWFVMSIGIFLFTEIALGILAGNLLQGYTTQMVHYRIQVILHLTSFLLGGFVVGAISPGIRITEPALAAFCSVGLTMIFAWFVPQIFLRLELSKLFLGGGLAFVLAFSGAMAGEKFVGNKV